MNDVAGDCKLSEAESKGYFIKPPDYINAILSGEEFFIQFQRFTPEIDSILIKIIHRFLEQHDILFIKDSVISITKELVNNAVKANLKRLFFNIKGLDMNVQKNYREGMDEFREAVFQTEDNDIIKSLEGSRFVVRVNFSCKNNYLHISVINNNPIIEAEMNKIKARINKAYMYTDMSEAFDDVLDDSEGAGLGLIMASMLVKNCGLPRDAFSISRTEKLTSITLSIPQNMSTQEARHRIAEEILKEIDQIPAIPDNIRDIRLLCRDPKSDFKVIAAAISRDPGLAASIIKLSNTAAYITSGRIDTIDEAVKIIGLKGINTLLIATGVMKIVETRYKKFEVVWSDSYKRAFYAQLISRKKNPVSKTGDQVYLSALLADIGKIVLLTINPELSEKIMEISGFKGLTDLSLLEEISLGTSHSSLGALICKKWNFNESLTTTVELHHAPHRSPEIYRELIYTVYLADVFVEIEKNRYRFEIVNDDVLKFFDLSGAKAFSQYHDSLKDAYRDRDKINP